MKAMGNRSRLCRLMCGWSLTFRADYFNLFGPGPGEIAAELWIVECKPGEKSLTAQRGGRAAE